MKVWERVIESRLRKDISISENQFGFMPGRLTIEAIYLLRRLMALYRDKKVDLHMVFIDLEKTYDRVPREVLWRCLDKKGVAPVYIQVTKDIYEGRRTSVRMLGGVTNDFFVGRGLHQSSALNPFLFTVVMDKLTRGIQDEAPWCMLFTDDIVLIDKIRQEVNDRLERWRHALESRGFRVSRSKTEYLHCCFSGRVDAGGEVTLDGRLISKVDKFKYLGSIIQRTRDIDEDINQRIKVGW